MSRLQIQDTSIFISCLSSIYLLCLFACTCSYFALRNICQNVFSQICEVTTPYNSLLTFYISPLAAKSRTALLCNCFLSYYTVLYVHTVHASKNDIFVRALLLDHLMVAIAQQHESKSQFLFLPCVHAC